MEKDDINLLTLKEYYLVESLLTQKPFFDEKMRCYLFEIKSDASAFCKDMKNVKILDAKTYRTLFVSELYGYGATSIRIKPRNGGFKDIAVDNDIKQRKYLNPETCKNIIMLRQTSKKKYARNLKNGKFLSPVLIDPRYVKKYPEIHYSYATFNNDSRYYILFTTLEEFEDWNEEQPQDWKPVELQLHKVGRIRKKNSVLINPLSEKIVLDDSLIREILRG